MNVKILAEETAAVAALVKRDTLEIPDAEKGAVYNPTTASVDSMSLRNVAATPAIAMSETPVFTRKLAHQQQQTMSNDDQGVVLLMPAQEHQESKLTGATSSGYPPIYHQ